MRAGFAAILIIGVAAPAAWASQGKPTPTPTPDHVVYQPKYKDPVIKELEDRDKAEKKKAEDATAAIRDVQKAKKDADEKKATTLRFDMSKVVRPADPEAFKQGWHFPPQAQYLTGTCWSFSTTSFYESEVYRLTGQKIKLSEIWTVYWEYVEKMKRFVRERGDSLVEEGSEGNAFQPIWPVYGVVTEEAYPGVLDKDGRHDHARLIERLQALGKWFKDNDIWDEDLTVDLTRVILDHELGRPPVRFAWEGTTYTPQEFLARVVRLKMDDYVEMMSTLSAPFYTKAEYKVPDNWWHDASYNNVPLDEWYAGIVRTLEQGATVAIGGDVSEPGLNGFEDAAVIPTFDIPQALINQDSRELRIDNATTQDDHGLHLVGMTKAGGHVWFLIKDSGRSSRWGKFPGYYFYRDDFVRLKMLTYTVHKDFVKDILAKVK